MHNAHFGETARPATCPTCGWSDEDYYTKDFCPNYWHERKRPMTGPSGDRFSGAWRRVTPDEWDVLKDAGELQSLVDERIACAVQRVALGARMSELSRQIDKWYKDNEVSPPHAQPIERLSINTQLSDYQRKLDVSCTEAEARESVPRERIAAAIREKDQNMTTAQKCAAQDDGFLNDYD